MKKMSSYIPSSEDDSQKQPGFADLVEQTLSQDVLDSVKSEKELRETHNSKERTKREQPLAPQRQLDLHGCTLLEAQRKTRHFLENCHHFGLQKVRIITGKGLHSDGQPVLPDGIELMLKEIKERNEIHSFHWEKNNRQSGAIIVLLK